MAFVKDQLVKYEPDTHDEDPPQGSMSDYDYGKTKMHARAGNNNCLSDEAKVLEVRPGGRYLIQCTTGGAKIQADDAHLTAI